MATVKVKTVNRTGKSLVKKALVVKAKKTSSITAENIKRRNEDLISKKSAVAEAVADKQETKRDEVKQDKKYELTIGLKDMFDAGCHLGHKVSKTHPKAKEGIYMAKDGVQVIDLAKSIAGLEKACTFIYNAQRNGKKIVLVGTKRQAREVVRRVATEAGVAYVTDRWLGGTITNWEQIRKDIKKLIDLKDGLAKGKYTESTKKELLEMNREVIRLEKIIGGLVSLDRLFDIIFVVDPGFEKTALREARLRKVKTVAIVDTDSNPKKLDYPIVANDDNVKSITVIVEEIGKAIKAAGVK